MLIARNDEASPAKGWYLQLSHLALPAIGFANQGINEPHSHRQLREVYLIARGSSTMVIDGVSVELGPGDVIVVEPGEVHTFTANSADYFHFVLHCPPVVGDKVLASQVS
jgi:mannose-6-phosphate isomerase-like protein (cupin superfamily)